VHESFRRARDVLGLYVDAEVAALSKIKVELDPDEHVDRRGGKTSRLEPPLGNGCYGFFVEGPTSSERTMRISDRIRRL
jgi:hypothetical protein